jgi:hypothetical protein
MPAPSVHDRFCVLGAEAHNDTRVSPWDFRATLVRLAYSYWHSCFPGRRVAGFGAALKRSEESMGAVRMLLSTEFASESDLLDRVMEQGIVVEVWDRVELGGIDMTGMRISVSSIRLFSEGRNPPFRAGYFWKVEPS